MSTDLNSIVQFLWREADLLDSKDYQAWLDLWDEDGKYIVPIEREGENYEEVLNYAYDDAAMRRMRVARLTNGESVSAAAAAITVRVLSRFRQIEPASDGSIRVRCAQHLAETNRGSTRMVPCDVTYTLREADQGYRLAGKVVLLANSQDTLTNMTYLP